VGKGFQPIDHKRRAVTKNMLNAETLCSKAFQGTGTQNAVL